MKRHGFTLIEMMIAISIFSVMVLFLYESLSQLRTANSFYSEKVRMLSERQKVYKTLYLDLALSIPKSVKIRNIDKESDFVTMQTSHSVHHRIMPFVAYLVKEGRLYRIESSKAFEQPLRRDVDLIVDTLMEAKTFRLYASASAEHHLLHFEDGNGFNLIKVRALNQ